MLINYNQKKTHQLLELLMKDRRSSEDAQRTCQGILCKACQQHPKQKILQAVNEQSPLSLILPAFPAKSANRQKTLSEKTDLGEIMGLTNLNQLCHSMQELYEPGVKLIICSDARVFNDLVLVSDQDVDIYQIGIKQIIQDHHLTHVTTFSLDEVYPYRTYQDMRQLLITDFGESLEELKQDIKNKQQLRYQFNGIHRFVVEDQLALKPLQSKNQVRNETKQIAYEVIQRSNAWSRLLSNYFPSSVRLSIHPQPCGSEKLGIQFLPTTNRWATPWHNVLLKKPQGWQLVKRQEALRLGATLNHDHYVLEAC